MKCRLDLMQRTFWVMAVVTLVGCASRSIEAPENTSPDIVVETASIDSPDERGATRTDSPAADVTSPFPEERAPELTEDDLAKLRRATAFNRGLEPGEQIDGKASVASAGLPRKLVLSREALTDGWIALFDGHSLFGWKANSDANWAVKDGVVTADSGKPGLLLTTVRFADFELKCDYRLAAGGNSGVFLRTVFEPKNPAKDCYELNMCDTHPAFATGCLVARAKTADKLIGEDGQWHSFHVRCDGKTIAVQFDGKSVLEFDDSTDNLRREGLIGLQMNGGKVEFKNVFLKPLASKPLFNGKDLAGWRVVPGSKSAFEVKDGAIHVENGPGFLETEATYANFILQGEARTNGEKLNSGVFFRAMPGTEKEPSNGYEFQIQNGFNDNDRTKPADFGTGAIFRREKARYVVPNDREWFAFTLVADGPKFATWVDGYPVVAWTDDRPPDENPRKGKRLEAGHFSLQGHDPTTNLDFRALRVVELPAAQ